MNDDIIDSLMYLNQCLCFDFKCLSFFCFSCFAFPAHRSLATPLYAPDHIHLSSPAICLPHMHTYLAMHLVVDLIVLLVH